MTAALPARLPGRRALQGAAPFAPVLIFLAALFFVPIAMLLVRSVTAADGSGLSAVHFARLFQSTAYVGSLWLTVKIAFWTALPCVGIGYPLAYLVANAKKNAGTTLMLCVLVPYWAGVLVRTFAWMVLLSRNGPANKILVQLGIVDAPLQIIYNFTGVMIGMVNAYTPLAVLVMSASMQSVDRRLLSAASTLGAGAGQAFWRVYFPLALPGVVSAFLLIFIASLGTFITPSLLGSGNDVMIAQVMIQQVEQLLNWGFAGAVGVLILGATLLIFAAFSKLFGMDALTGRAANSSASTQLRVLGGAGRRILMALGHATDVVRARLGLASASRTVGAVPLAVWVVSLAVLAFLITPTLFLVPVSFSDGSFIEWPPKGFSTRWYRMIASGDWLLAGWRSIYVAALAAVCAVALALPAAIALTRRRVRGQRIILALVLAPMIIPHLLHSVALLLVFGPLGLVGTDVGLVMGHTVVCLPYVLITLVAVLNTFDYRLVQAAGTLGAGSWQRLWRVTLPLIRPGLLAAFIIAFITSFEELTIAMFVTGGLSATLPKKLWADMLMSVSPALAAVSTLMIAFVVVLVGGLHVLRRQSGAAADSKALLPAAA